jgi:hypothetical protein
MKFIRVLLWTQSIYTFITAIWPILDIESFMIVTGPKTDIWLVKTVGALLIPVSLTLASYLFIKTNLKPAAILGGLSAAVFITIDFYYPLTDVISNVYMLDGILQIGFLICWAIVLLKMDHRKNET